MEAEARPKTAIRAPALERDWRDVLFSLVQARQALPYVARVVADAADALRDAQQCRTALLQGVPAAQRGVLIERFNQALVRLNFTIDEFNAVGADLVDLGGGLVRFKARIDDRLVELMWRRGEPVIDAWPAIDDRAQADEAMQLPGAPLDRS